MHSVAVINLLRQRALPNTDMTDPAQVLATLNAMFPMEDNAGMYFTMWYGVFDTVSRRLDFASGGHHPAYLVEKARREAVPLKTRNGLIGALPVPACRADHTSVPPGTSLYLFSDGVFEIVTIDGLQWGLQDFLPHLLAAPVAGLSEPQRLYREVGPDRPPRGAGR